MRDNMLMERPYNGMGDVTPFATSTEIGFSELQRNIWQGIGMGIGLSVAGFVIMTIVGRKLW